MLFARRNTILFLVLLMLFSCNPNESINSYDYRDDVIGTYEGFKVDTRWKDTLVGWTHDTTLTQVIVAKAAEDSMVTVIGYDFLLRNGEFITQPSYHPPLITRYQDSLYIYHHPVLGPWFIKYYVNKLP
jgi:hypothetical protein